MSMKKIRKSGYFDFKFYDKNGNPIGDKNIKHVLVDKNITQKELAEAMGVSDGYISYVVNGYKIPSAEMRKKIARVLGVKEKEIFEIWHKLLNISYNIALCQCGKWGWMLEVTLDWRCKHGYNSKNK